MLSSAPILISVLLSVNFVDCQFSRSDVADRPRDLSRLVDEVLSEYYVKFRCLTYLLEDAEDVLPISGRYQVFLIRLDASNSSGRIDRLLRESHEQGCGGFLLQVDSSRLGFVMDRVVAAKKKAVCCRYNNQRYLILPTKTPDFAFMNHPNLTYFPNLVYLTANANASGAFVAFGHTIFDHYKRDVLKITHEVLDYWYPESGFRYRRNLFPDRLMNVTGRKFTFAALQYPPFNLALNENGRTVFDGFETRIAALFVDMVNGTWEAKNHDELWGELFDNGTGTGVVGAIVAEKADLGFSGVYQWFCEDVDCIRPYYQSGITCLVPRPKLLSEWLTIVLPFTESTWLALIITYFFNTAFFLVLLLIMKHLRGLSICHHVGLSLSDSFLTIFRIQLEQIPRITKFYEPLAVYIRVMVFFYYFVAAFWQGGIASSLTVPRYERPIDETADLVQRWPNIQWGADSNAWVHSIRASSDPNLVEIVNKFVVLDEKTLFRKSKTGDFGFFTEELPHGHYGFSEYIKEESLKYLRLMKKKIYTAFGVIILPKGSPFTEKLDRIVHRLYDTGIIHKLEVQAILDRTNNKLQNMIRSSNEKPSNSVILAVRHIHGSLYIFGIGMTAALLVFIIEIFTFRHSRRLFKIIY